MKNLIISTIAGVSMLAIGASCYGQGTIAFANTSSQAITFGAQAPNPGAKMFGPAGSFTFGLYVGAAGSTSFSQLTLIDTVASPNAPAATSFNAGLFASPANVSGQGNVGAANGFAGLVGSTTYVVSVAGWTTTAGNSLAAALANGTGITGVTGLGSITAASGSAGVPDVFGSTGGGAGLGGFALNPTVPEPTTIALGGLGAAALLFFRRRK